MIRTVILDVNETLLDLTPLGDRFVAAGAPAHLVPLWFSNVLRDGFALTLAGEFIPFRQLAIRHLAAMLAGHGVDDSDDAAGGVVDAIARLPLHPDVPAGLRALRGAGATIATMTNGSAEVTEAVLNREGVLDLVDLRLDIQGPQRWKLAPEAYRYAVERCGASAAESMLVATHPWDVRGASRAGLTGGWLNRDGGAWPFDPPPRAEFRELAAAAALVF